MPRRKNQDKYVEKQIKMQAYIPTFEEAKEERIELVKSMIEQYDPLNIENHLGRNELIVVTMSFNPLNCFVKTY